MFPVGLFLMFSAWGKQFLWTTTLFLGLQAVITFIILAKLADLFSVTISTVLVLIFSYFIEWWGVNTGFPFGYYSYTDVLKPIINGVPLAITFAWFVVTANSMLAAKYFLKNTSIYTIAFISAVFILATDILLEPFASFVNNYWVWAENKIPLQNFLNWLFCGFLFSLLLDKIIKWKNNFPNQKNLLKIPLIIIGINLLNFTIVNLANGYFALTITGLIMFAIVILSLIKFKPNEN